MMKIEQLTKLPGIDGWYFNEQELGYQFAIWGKNNGTQDDYGIIAKSLDFKLNDEKLGDILNFGNDLENSQSILSWRVYENIFYAQKLYLSDKYDNDNRQIVEAIVICSEIPATEIPAAIQALLLLPYLDNCQNSDFFLNLPSAMSNFMEIKSPIKVLSTESLDPLLVMEDGLLNAFDSGVDFIKSNFSQQNLIFFYEIILENNAISYLPKLSIPLSPLVIGVLFSFLPRSLANTLSLVEKVPTTSIKYKRFFKSWNGVLSDEFGDVWDNNKKNIATENKDKALQSAQALFDFSGDITFTNAKEQQVQKELNPEVNFTIWGSTSSGKTAYISQLFLHKKMAGEEENWEISQRTEATRIFLEDQRERLRSDCRFPMATITGSQNEENIELGIVNKKTSDSAIIIIEDRAGVNYEKMTDDMVQIMVNSNGLLIVLDTSRSIKKLESEIEKTFTKIRHLLLDSSDTNEMKKFPKPVAFCLTKIDFHINDLEMLKRTRDYPDIFARELIINGSLWKSGGKEFIELVNGHCENFSLFPVSAVGLRVNKGVVESLVFYDNDMESRVMGGDGVETINLVLPFIWLIKQLNG